MNLLGRVLSRLTGATAPKAPARSTPVTRRGGMQSKYEAADHTTQTAGLWSSADDLGPNAATASGVRYTLRRRARAERDNDPHLNGLLKTLAHDKVGTGPRLQLQLGAETYAAARLVEQSFAAWAKAADLAEKLRLLDESRPVDGETFALLTANERLPHPVKMDVRCLESEQVADPSLNTDGIRYDAAGNPTEYCVLREHPGDSYLRWTGGSHGYGAADWIPARNVLHWFRPSRPGQLRGVSELAAALLTGSQTRRFASAVLTAAEFAAMLAGVLTTDQQPESGDPPTIEAMDEFPLTKGQLLTLPKGWDAKQFNATQPTATYKEYVTEKRSEMARPVLAPRNLVTGDSSDFNFASGRLDHLPYQRIVWIERDRLRARVVDRIFLAWLREADLVGLIPDGLPPINEWVWDWQWDGFQQLDPVKETNAIESRLRLGLTTLSEECAAGGTNWRDNVDQRVEEVAYQMRRCRDAGVDFSIAFGVGATTPAAPRQPVPVPDDTEDPANV